MKEREVLREGKLRSQLGSGGESFNLSRERKFQNQHNIDPQAPKYWLALAPKYRRCHRARCLYDLKQSKTAERNNENGRFRGISETNSTSMFTKIWTVMKVFSSELSYNLARVMNYQE